jgi:hypothetical protein
LTPYLHSRWLRQLHINVDANFRQRNQGRARGAFNPPVTNGKGYWVDLQEFNQHIVSRTDDEDVRKAITLLESLLTRFRCPPAQPSRV